MIDFDTMIPAMFDQLCILKKDDLEELSVSVWCLVGDIIAEARKRGVPPAELKRRLLDIAQELTVKPDHHEPEVELRRPPRKPLPDPWW